MDTFFRNSLFLLHLSAVLAAPAFNNIPTTTYLDETTATPQQVWGVGAYGLDRPYRFRINWDGSDPVSGRAPFKIFRNNGSVMFDATYTLNYDIKPAYTLNICARDVNDVDTCDDLTIELIDQPSEPVWQNLPDTITIPEDTPIGTTIFAGLATDLDFGDLITYSIKQSLPSGAPVVIDSITGNITNTALFNYEAVQKYEITFTATDGPLNPTEKFAILTVEITDVNELPAVDIASNVQVWETAQAQKWYDQTNTDPEGNPVTYDLACIPAACPFRINALTGDITLDPATGTLDYEVIDAFVLTVTVDDSIDIVTHTINVEIMDYNDPPTFLNLDDWIEVAEDTVLAQNAANNFLFQVLMDDEENDDLEYFITVQPDPGTVTIDKDTGFIKHTANPGFDFEEEPLHTIIVHVTDGTTMVGPRYYYLNVTDEKEPPIIKNLPHTMCLSEDIQDTVSFFGLVWDDDDESPRDTWKTTITGGPFGINNNTGVISTSGDPNFDYNTVQTYTTTVTVEDRYGLSDSQTLTVCVAGQSPRPPKFNVRGPDLVRMDEEQTLGTVITGINLAATDRDVNNGDVLTWTMENTPGSENFFFDDSTNPPQVQWNADIDREALSGPIFYNLKFTVTDVTPGETDVKWATVIVEDKNDNDPVMLKSRYTATIPENQPVDSSVLAVSATDADVYLADPTYSISPTNTYFKINANNGQIYVKNSPDYETVQSVSFNVVATDSGGRTSTSVVDITITDLNDNPPVWESLYYNFEVKSDAPVDYAVGKVAATDVDTVGVNLYFLDSVSSEFYLDNKTGVIYVRTEGLLVNGTEYTLKAIAQDTETVPQKSLTTTIRIDAYPACNMTVSVDVTKVGSYFQTVGALSGFSDPNGEVFMQKIQGLFASGSLGRLISIDGQEWPIFDGIGKGKQVSYIEFIMLRDSSTEVITSVNTDTKKYRNATEMLEVLLKNDPENLPDGHTEPSSLFASAAGGSFPVDAVWETDTCPPDPLHWWTQTPEGITTQTFIAMACLAALGMLLALMMFLCGKRLLFGPYPKCPNIKDLCKDCCKKTPKPVEPKKIPEVPKGDDKVPDFRYNKKDGDRYFKNFDPKLMDRDTMSPSGVALEEK